MTMKNDFFEQILTISSEIVNSCNEDQRRHGWVKSESKKEIEKIQTNDNLSKNETQKEDATEIIVSQPTNDNTAKEDEKQKIEKKEVFDELKIKENIIPQPTPETTPEKVEKVVDETSQATAIPDSYRVLFGGDKR